MKSLHLQLFQDSWAIKADATVCTQLVPVAAVPWLMAENAASKSLRLWVNELQSWTDRVNIRAKNCTQVSDGLYCFFGPAHLLLHAPNKNSLLTWSLGHPSNLDHSSGEPVLTCAIYRPHHSPPGGLGGKNKTAPSKKLKKKPHTNLVTECKLEREHIPPSFQRRTTGTPNLFG